MEGQIDSGSEAAKELKGVDPNIKNDFGRVAFEEALQGGHSVIADLLASLTKLDDEKIYYSDAGDGDSDKGEESVDEEELFGAKDDEIVEQKVKVSGEEQMRDTDSDTGSMKHRRQVREAKQIEEMKAKKEAEDKQKLEEVS